MNSKINKLRENKLLLQFVKNVPFDGWSWNALYNSADDLNIYKKELTENDKADLRDFFDNEIEIAVKKFNDYLDNEMEKKFIKLKLSNQKIPIKIKKLIMLRINACSEYKDAVRSSFALMSLPQNSKSAMKMLYKTCDLMWRVSNDKSTDFSFYTKRLILSGIYTSTIFYWLNENNLKKVEDFLDRRLSDVNKFGRFKNYTENFSKVFNNRPNPIDFFRNFKNNRFSFKSSK